MTISAGGIRIQIAARMDELLSCRREFFEFGPGTLREDGVTGVTVEGVRPVHSAGPQSTVEIMAGSGLKYVHATSKGRQVKDSQRIVYYYMK